MPRSEVVVSRQSSNETKQRCGRQRATALAAPERWTFSPARAASGQQRSWRSRKFRTSPASCWRCCSSSAGLATRRQPAFRHARAPCGGAQLSSGRFVRCLDRGPKRRPGHLPRGPTTNAVPARPRSDRGLPGSSRRGPSMAAISRSRGPGAPRRARRRGAWQRPSAVPHRGRAPATRSTRRAPRAPRLAPPSAVPVIQVRDPGTARAARASYLDRSPCHRP